MATNTITQWLASFTSSKCYQVYSSHKLTNWQQISRLYSLHAKNNVVLTCSIIDFYLDVSLFLQRCMNTTRNLSRQRHRSVRVGQNPFSAQTKGLLSRHRFRQNPGKQPQKEHEHTNVHDSRKSHPANPLSGSRFKKVSSLSSTSNRLRCT